MDRKADQIVQLPAPRYDGGVALEHALLKRRSVREFRKQSLTLAEISQLLWSTQGITQSGGFRTAPSAGALYPLEVYVGAGNVGGLAPGLHRYRPAEHDLIQRLDADPRNALQMAALNQQWIASAPALFVITAVQARTEAKYGTRAERYVLIEVGHATQNLLLQAVSLGLGAVVVGAFDDETVARILKLPGGEAPIHLVPVGHPDY